MPVSSHDFSPDIGSLPSWARQAVTVSNCSPQNSQVKLSVLVIVTEVILKGYLSPCLA